MHEIIIPKKESDTGGHGHIPEGYEKVVWPDQMKQEDKIEFFQEALNRTVNKLRDTEERFNELKKIIDKNEDKLDKLTFRNVEILGIFSAILALIIIDVNIIKYFESFLSAILLIIALSCSMVIFISLIHLFFSPEDKAKLGKSFWIPNIILIILVMLGLLLYFFNININKVKTSENQSKISTPTSTPLIKNN